MRPTPRKLAMLMSLAGLGLSLGELAHAKSDVSARPDRVPAFGLEGVQSDGDEAATASSAPDVAAIPAGPLDVKLSTPETAASLSEEDRAAVALAMVLMAEPPSSQTSVATREFAPSDRRWEVGQEFLREIGDTSSPGETPAASPVPTAVNATIDRVDLHLDLSGGVETVASSATAVDVNLDSPAVLDLNLDLGLGLDLNLDLAPEVDLRLDRPPVFAVTRLKPLGSAMRSAESARTGELAARACTADEPLMALQAPAPNAIPLARAESVEHEPAEPALAAARDQAVPVAVTAPAAVGAEAKVAPKVASTIVVASHSDRVLRSLETLLTNDDLAAARIGAQPDEVFVTSHAEKALLMLASTCAGEEPGQPAAAEPLRPSKVEPAVACKPSAKAPVAGTARRSVIGGEAIALSSGDLDKVRGGFETSNGLKISFGIERAVYINGSLVTTTSLNVSDLGKVSGGAAAAATAVAGSGNLTLIQNGAGNTFVSGPVSAATVGTIVQNTLNDQKIQSVTAINATVNSLQMVRAQNFQSSLRGAVIDSLRR